MVIVKIFAGLGNQMFQYAFAKSLQKKGYEVKIDLAFDDTNITNPSQIFNSFGIDKYNIDLPVCSKRDRKKFKTNIPKFLRKIVGYKSKIIRERGFNYNSSYLNPEDENYMIGFFQSEKYFKNIRSLLLKEFTIQGDTSNYYKTLAKKITNTNCSCSIHIRRGDYLSDRYVKTHHVCDLEYFIRAISVVESKYLDVVFFVFSDDINWAQSKFKKENLVFIDGDNRYPQEDMHLMSLCKHNILSNSSYSWWGAWLNQNESKEIFIPKKWFKDETLEKQSVDIPCPEWKRV